MLRERAVGESLWEAVLPAELRELPAELAKVDAILDEDRFLAPFRSRLTRLAKRLKAAGLAPRSRLRDRRRSVGKRVRAISAARVRGRPALATLYRLTGDIAGRAKQTVREAQAVAQSARRNARRFIWPAGRS